MKKRKIRYWRFINRITILWMAIIIMSVLIYVAKDWGNNNIFLFGTAAVCVAVIACVCEWKIFRRLLVKNKHERIKAEELVGKKRKTQK